MSCYLVWLVCAFLAYKVVDWLICKPWVKGRLQKHIFITGCDSGFGFELAKRLDSQGVKVFAGCLTEKGEEVLRKQCSSQLKTVPLNVSKPESVRKAYDIVKKSLPPGQGLWAIMNNAGISGKIGPACWLEIADYEEVFAVNLYGVIDCTKVFLPLIKKEKGRVVSTASIFGRTSLIGAVPYTISKYGAEAFSDGIRRELREYGCSVSIIEPGFHKTNISSTANLNKWYDATWNKLSPELREEYGEEYFKQSKELVVDKFIDRIASDCISDVVDAYEHAIMGMFPRARYVVGLDAKLFWLPVQWLPEWLGDWILTVANKDRSLPAVLKKRN